MSNLYNSAPPPYPGVPSTGQTAPYPQQQYMPQPSQPMQMPMPMPQPQQPQMQMQGQTQVYMQPQYQMQPTYYVQPGQQYVMAPGATTTVVVGNPYGQHAMIGGHLSLNVPFGSHHLGRHHHHHHHGHFGFHF